MLVAWNTENKSDDEESPIYQLSIESLIISYFLSKKGVVIKAWMVWWADSIQVRSECPLPPIAQSPSVSPVFASPSVFWGSQGFLYRTDLMKKLKQVDFRDKKIASLT